MSHCLCRCGKGEAATALLHVALQWWGREVVLVSVDVCYIGEF